MREPRRAWQRRAHGHSRAGFARVLGYVAKKPVQLLRPKRAAKQ